MSNNMNDSNMKIFLLNDGAYRGAVLDATEMVEKMQKAHKTGILETYALGETYIAAGLLTSMLKGRDRLGIVFECGGPIKGINAEVTADGHVRGFLKNNPFPLDKIPESLDLSMLFGPGFLSVIKYLEDSKQPFTGQVMITYGSIANDLAYYFTTSENLPTAFNLSVKFTKEGDLLGAGGIFIQKLPDKTLESGVNDQSRENDPDSEAQAVQDAVTSMPSIGKTLSEGVTPAEIISNNFGDFFPNVIGSRRIEFKCSCSRELFGNYLYGLAADDKKEIYENGPFPVVTTCHNCNTSYSFEKAELKKIFGY